MSVFLSPNSRKQTMDDKRPLKSNNLPSWQLKESFTAANNESQDFNESSSSSRQTLLDQAATFLLDESIRDAPWERKRSFLETKGLSVDEINGLLQAGNNESSQSHQAENKSKIPESFLIASSRKSVEGVEEPSSAASSATSSEHPPIITYPEFLLHIQQPPPLITAQRMRASLYTAFVLGLTVYGTSTFLISPMIDALSSARHSVYETCSKNIELMNEKLVKTVSKVPDEFDDEEIHSLSRKRSPTDLDSADFFQRSVATQTTPEISRFSSPDILSPMNDTPLRKQQNLQLQSLNGQLRGLLTSETVPEDTSNSVKSRLNQFQSYLDNLTYGSLLISSGYLKTSNEDEFSKLKVEIRSFKGALLSARSFPSGAGVRGRGQV